MYSKRELEAEIDMLEAEYGDRPGCGGSWNFDGPPCGGCIDCFIAMASHHYQLFVDQKSLFKRAGFEYAPWALNTETIYHTADGWVGTGGHHYLIGNACSGSEYEGCQSRQNVDKLT